MVNDGAFMGHLPTPRSLPRAIPCSARYPIQVSESVTLAVYPASACASLNPFLPAVNIILTRVVHGNRMRSEANMARLFCSSRLGRRMEGAAVLRKRSAPS